MSSYNTQEVLDAVAQASSKVGARLEEMQRKLDYSAVASKSSPVDLASIHRAGGPNGH